MTDPFVAEIRVFPFEFAPHSWAFCDGQVMPISQNTALFSLLGTDYGGDGKSTFALPDLQGAAAIGSGFAASGTSYARGDAVGSATVTLLPSEIPAHTHAVQAADEPALLQAPAADRALAASAGGDAYGPATGDLAAMSPEAVSVAGGSLPHQNRPPSLAMNFCISLQGVFPSRS